MKQENIATETELNVLKQVFEGMKKASQTKNLKMKNRTREHNKKILEIMELKEGIEENDTIT